MKPQTFTDVPSTRKPSSLSLRLQAGADKPRPNICEVQKNHPNPAQPSANSSKRRIKRDRTLGAAFLSIMAVYALTRWMHRGNLDLYLIAIRDDQATAASRASIRSA